MIGEEEGSYDNGDDDDGVQESAGPIGCGSLRRSVNTVDSELGLCITIRGACLRYQ